MSHPLSPPSAPPPATRSGPRGPRLHGVDVARGLAIVGMLTRHVGPTSGDPAVASAAWFYTRADGRAAVLFALVAGVGVALLADRRPPRWLTGRLLYRAVWLLPLGLWLQGLDHPVAVILHFYALYFVAVRPFAYRSDAVVLTAAAVAAVVGPGAVLAAQIARPEWSTHLGGDPPNLAVELLLTGFYPLASYLAPVLVGLWLGRWLRRWQHDGAPSTPIARLTALAASVSVGIAALSVPVTARVAADPSTVTWLVSVDGHSQAPLWVIASTSTAVAVVTVCCWLSDRWPRTSAPAAAFGRLALTVYVGHLLAFAVLPMRWMRADAVPGGLLRVGVIVVLGTSLAVAWLAWRPRGPLEGAERWPFAVLFEPLLRTAEHGATRPVATTPARPPDGRPRPPGPTAGEASEPPAEGPRPDGPLP